MRINLMIWRIKSLIKNFRKGKFKAFLRYFYDESYRKDVDYMLQVVRAQDVVLDKIWVPLIEITPGHDINYPMWVEHLRWQIKNRGYRSLHPIKVILDDSTGKYLIVDGNHRYAAMRKELGSFLRVEVQVLLKIKRKRRTK